MHIYFSAIGGTAIGPLAMIAKQAGFEVSGSDKQDSQYIQYLRKNGLEDVHIGQSHEQIAEVHAHNPIDWYVYSSAVSIEQPDAPEFTFCSENNIKMTKRDDFINFLLKEKNLKMIAVAGTHGKTTTTAMAVWLFKQIGIPISYSIGAKISFGDMGHFDANSEYFVYEADEFDRNFLSYHPAVSIITGLDYDHPDIYLTRDDYNQAFKEFLNQTGQTFIWKEDADRIGVQSSDSVAVIHKEDYPNFTLAGKVNRENAAIVAQTVMHVTGRDDITKLIDQMNSFPGVSRRFEKIINNVYSDYAHTPGKIEGALQMAHEVAGDNVVVIYEGLHNTRQHFIKEELIHLFDSVKQLYVVPSYRAREDESLEDLTPEKIIALTAQPEKAEPAVLDETLLAKIKEHANVGDLVLCLTAGGGGSLDEWLRVNL